MSVRTAAQYAANAARAAARRASDYAANAAYWTAAAKEKSNE